MNLKNVFDHIGHNGYLKQYPSGMNMGGVIKLGTGTIVGDGRNTGITRAVVDIVVPKGKRILGPRGGIKGYTDLALAGVVIDPIIHREKLSSTFFCDDCHDDDGRPMELSFPKPMRLSKSE